MNIPINKDSNKKCGEETFSPGYLKAMNYHNFIYKNIEPFLGSRIIEIGCGPGVFSRKFQEKGLLLAIDKSNDIILKLREGKEFKNDVIFIQDDIEKFDSFDFCMNKQPDTIVGINVLEHIENDEALLRNLYALLKGQKGRVILLVPAFKMLYGRIDKLAGHFRRYDQKELLKKMRDTGFDIENIYYFNSLGIVIWFLSNLLMKPDNIAQKSISSSFLFYDKMIVPILNRIERAIKPLFGLSIIAVGRAGK